MYPGDAKWPPALNCELTASGDSYKIGLTNQTLQKFGLKIKQPETEASKIAKTHQIQLENKLWTRKKEEKRWNTPTHLSNKDEPIDESTRLKCGKYGLMALSGLIDPVFSGSSSGLRSSRQNRSKLRHFSGLLFAGWHSLRAVTRLSGLTNGARYKVTSHIHCSHVRNLL